MEPEFWIFFFSNYFNKMHLTHQKLRGNFCSLSIESLHKCVESSEQKKRIRMPNRKSVAREIDWPKLRRSIKTLTRLLLLLVKVVFVSHRIISSCNQLWRCNVDFTCLYTDFIFFFEIANLHVFISSIIFCQKKNR